ncbi:MAG: hypothetical protein J6R66_05740 [Clostridia bacterium]|nr:hypothetical protein [Clostridia bacterium]
MWIVVYITQNREASNIATELLREAGLSVKVRTVGTKSENVYGCYEILLPESQVEEGHRILISNLF